VIKFAKCRVRNVWVSRKEYYAWTFVNISNETFMMGDVIDFTWETCHLNFFSDNENWIIKFLETFSKEIAVNIYNKILLTKNKEL
jgi:hypothetical protein